MAVEVGQLSTAGWRATVNGRPAQVLRANHAFRAVAVPAGSGRIVFTYWPKSLTIGLILATTAGVVLLSMVIFARTRNRVFLVDSGKIEPVDEKS